MPTNFALSSEYTMAEVAKTLGADGNELAFVDTLSQRTPFLEEGYWMEADDFNSHHFSQALSEPSGSDSVNNVGVAWEVANVVPVTEIIQGIESWLRIDLRTLRRKRNPEQYITQQVGIFINGLKKTIHDRILYGNNATYPDRITGLQPRYNLSASAPWANVTLAGGHTATTQSSAWTLKWGPDAVYFVYPHGGQDFIKIEKYPDEIVYDPSGNPYKAYCVHFEIHFGLCIADPRKISRLANIEGTDHAWTADLQLNNWASFPDQDTEGCVLYVPPFVYTEIQVAAMDRTNVLYGSSEIFGRKVMDFQGVPIIPCGRLTKTEAVVT